MARTSIRSLTSIAAHSTRNILVEHLTGIKQSPQPIFINRRTIKTLQPETPLLFICYCKYNFTKYIEETIPRIFCLIHN